VCRRGEEDSYEKLEIRAISSGKDEGRPLGAGLQGQASNHPKRLLLRVVVVNVVGKGGKDPSGRNQKDELP
jgi:hypothetical protein